MYTKQLSQLQSRISLRRNYIRMLEEDIALAKRNCSYSYAKLLRQEANHEAKQQRLDRHLYFVYMAYLYAYESD